MNTGSEDRTDELLADYVRDKRLLADALDAPAMHDDMVARVYQLKDQLARAIEYIEGPVVCTTAGQVTARKEHRQRLLTELGVLRNPS